MIGKTNSKQAAGNAAQEFVNVQLSTNQSSHGDLAGAKVTVSYGTYTKDYTWSGSEITFTIPAYINYTVSFGSVEGYKTPASVSHSAIEDNARTIEAVYQCELVKVSVSADDGSSVNGAVVTINGKSRTWNGKVVEQKVPFGTSYSVSVGDFSGYIKPSSKSYTANSVSREVSMVYAASSLVVNILSNQGTDATIGAVQATVKYGSTSVNVVSGQRLNIPSGSAITITFPEVDGYLKPDDISFTHSGGAVVKSGEYKCELLTVNVSADEGVPTGFEITISKKEVLGANGEYTRLEYIEATGTQYIDTGFKPNQDTRVVMDVDTGTEWSQEFPCLFGVGYTSGNGSTDKFMIFMYKSIDGLHDHYGSQTINPSAKSPKGRHLIDKNKNKTYVDGTLVSSFSATSFQQSSNLPLLAALDGGVIGYYAKAKLYSCQIYDNGVLVRDYVPAVNSSDVAGMYDAVNNTFTTSVGSENFVAGRKAKEIIATQTSVTGSYKIPFGETYSVEAGNVSGFKNPTSITRVASERTFTANMQYTMVREIDLSLQDVYGNPINRSTANCYVVREPGTYKFPLVYGNAVKNGKVNTAAYTNNGGSYSHYFVKGYRTNEISRPYIIEDIGDTNLSNYRVTVSNKDEDNVISNLSIVEEDNGYIQFKANSIPFNGCNVVVSIITNSTVIWSWHLWLWPHDLTPVEITNAAGVKYNIMPVNLASKYDSDGVHIKNWFYQWGRPIPLLCPAAYNSTSNHSPGVIYISSKASELREGINMPSRFYCNTDKPYTWFGDKSYYNLWDAACTGTGASDNDTVKTVYDPCPVGWKVPNGNIFTGFASGLTPNVVGSFVDGYKFKRYSGDTTGVFFPVSGYIDGWSGELSNVGLTGMYFLSASESQNYSYHLQFYNSAAYVSRIVWRSYGASIRPVQDDITKIDTI